MTRGLGMILKRNFAFLAVIALTACSTNLTVKNETSGPISAYVSYSDIKTIASGSSATFSIEAEGFLQPTISKRVTVEGDFIGALKNYDYPSGNGVFKGSIGRDFNLKTGESTETAFSNEGGLVVVWNQTTNGSSFFYSLVADNFQNQKQNCLILDKNRYLSNVLLAGTYHFKVSGATNNLISLNNVEVVSGKRILVTFPGSSLQLSTL